MVFYMREEIQGLGNEIELFRANLEVKQGVIDKQSEECHRVGQELRKRKNALLVVVLLISLSRPMFLRF